MHNGHQHTRATVNLPEDRWEPPKSVSGAACFRFSDEMLPCPIFKFNQKPFSVQTVVPS